MKQWVTAGEERQRYFEEVAIHQINRNSKVAETGTMPLLERNNNTFLERKLMWILSDKVSFDLTVCGIFSIGSHYWHLLDLFWENRIRFWLWNVITCNAQAPQMTEQEVGSSEDEVFPHSSHSYCSQSPAVAWSVDVPVCTVWLYPWCTRI